MTDPLEKTLSQNNKGIWRYSLLPQSISAAVSAGAPLGRRNPFRHPDRPHRSPGPRRLVGRPSRRGVLVELLTRQRLRGSFPSLGSLLRARHRLNSAVTDLLRRQEPAGTKPSQFDISEYYSRDGSSNPLAMGRPSAIPGKGAIPLAICCLSFAEVLAATGLRSTWSGWRSAGLGLVRLFEESSWLNR